MELMDIDDIFMVQSSKIFILLNGLKNEVYDYSYS